MVSGRRWLICVVTFGLLQSSFPAYAFGAKAKSSAYPFRLSMPPAIGEISQVYTPESRTPKSKPDFVLIQNVHSNVMVQFALSQVLKTLRQQNVLPERLAIEGGVGPIDVDFVRSKKTDRERLEMANFMVAKGEMTGPAHFIVTEGRGELYGAESSSYLQPALDMFRRSYESREILTTKLNLLESAIEQMKIDTGDSNRASILQQDIQVIRRLIDQQLAPTEIHQVMVQSIFAVDHLKHFIPGKKQKALLEPVSAAVNFYAFALLRDKGLFKHAEELRRMDQQSTTVLIAGGFHTPGITRYLKEAGYSYVVITPQLKAFSPMGQKLYVQRLLGYEIPLSKKNTNKPLLNFESSSPRMIRPVGNKMQLSSLDLRTKLSTAPFNIPPIRDIFTAMDRPLNPAVKIALIKQRAEMLESARQIVLNR